MGIILESCLRDDHAIKNDGWLSQAVKMRPRPCVMITSLTASYVDHEMSEDHDNVELNIYKLAMYGYM